MLSVFDELHPTLARSGGRLRITKGYASWTKPVSELALVPSVFVWPHIGVIPSPGNRFTLVYPARAFASAIERSVADRPGSLSALLGPTRAALLTLCGSPLTGSWAARSLDMSPSTVSRHLNILSEAGLLRSERVGREVVFRQTHLGSAVADAACS
jgi:DNA-binding transcriptional ArsR family regulator